MFCAIGLRADRCQRKHQKKKPFRCNWPNCHTRTSTETDIRRHTESVHEKVVYWSCRDFEKIDLTPHLEFKTFSNGFKYYDVCGLCNSEFIHGRDGPNWRDMRRHAYEYHFCRPCPHAKEYFRSDSFRTHLRAVHKTEEVNNPTEWEKKLLGLCRKSREPSRPET
jgi:hypothetical protein